MSHRPGTGHLPSAIRHPPSATFLSRPFLYNLLAVMLLLAMAAQMMGSVRFKSATYDEQEYVARGYAVLRTGDMRLRLRHPLLTNLISALPLLLLPDLRVPTDHGSWVNAEFHEFSAQFLWNYNRQWADQIVYLSRWPMMLLTLVLAAFVHRWARALYGPPGALLALALVAFDPNLIAHGRLANTDIGATAFILIAAYAFWSYQRRRGWHRLLWAGIACGLAQTTRFTALLLFPIFGLQILVADWRREASLPCSEGSSESTSPPPPRENSDSRTGRGNHWRKLRHAITVLVALACTSLLTIWAVYGFTWGPVDGTPLSLPAPDHWGELLSLTRRLGRADPAFLLGRIYRGGWWPYFFVALAVKTPLPTLILIGWATAQLGSTLWPGGAPGRRLKTPVGARHAASPPGPPRNRHLQDALPLLLPAAAYFALSVTGNLNTGYRLILPILPFLAVHAARLAANSPTAHSPFAHLPFNNLSFAHLSFDHLSFTYLLLAWLALSTSLTYPHYLAYFNELVGPRNGYKVLVDSNLDWGQDLPGLRSWMDERGVEQVYLSWFGVAPPEHYGVRYRYLPGWPPFENPALRVYHPQRPLPGIYAISATNLVGVLLDDPDTFAFFRARPPAAQIGYSIFIYEVPPSGPPADLALGGVRFDEIPAVQLDAHFTTNNLRLRWFDPSTSLVLIPYRPGVCYAITDDHPLTDTTPLTARFLADLDALAAGPGFSLYPCPDEADVNRRLDIAAASSPLRSSEVEFVPGSAPDVRSPVPLPAPFDGQVAFLGHELITPTPAPGQEVALLTYWRVLKRPGHPLKVFVHLLDDHSHIWGQHDGLDVPVAGWHPGDIIVQLHSFVVVPDAPAGRYWIETGLYNPETMERLSVIGDDDTSLGNRLLLQELAMQ